MGILIYKIKINSHSLQEKKVDFAYNLIRYITALKFKTTTRRPQ